MTELSRPPIPVALPMVRSDHGCFGCGDANPIGLHLRFAPDGEGVRASFIPGLQHQGFDTVVHGGIISTVLDEAMAWATAQAGILAVTGEMRVRFRRPLHVGDPTTATARVSGCRGRIVTTTAELALDRDRSPIATASATFVRVSADVEAAWRARYLASSEILTDDVRAVPGVIKAVEGECDGIAPSCDDSSALGEEQIENPGRETPMRPEIDDTVQNELLTRARHAAEHAYTPYSGFPVGAAVLAVDGSIHTGCNVENASYGLTICAERSAVSAAVGAGQREIVAVAVSAPKASFTTPCGACRQVLNEFRPASSDMAVVLDDGASGNVIWLENLLPQSFGPRTLDAAMRREHADLGTTQDDHGR